MHFAAEEVGQQGPDAVLIDQLAGRAMGKRLAELAGLEREANVMFLA